MPPKDDALYIEEILEAIQPHRHRRGRQEPFSSLDREGARDSLEAGSGMRDRLTHAYAATDPQIVWKVVEEELKSLRAAAEKMRH